MLSKPYRGTGMMYRGGGGGGMSTTTAVVGAAVVLILALGGTTVYLLTTRESDESGDCSSVQSQLDAANAQIETLRGQLDSIASGGGGGGGVEKFIKQKTGFFGAPMWIFLVIGGVFAAIVFIRVLGKPLSRAIKAGGDGLTARIRSALSSTSAAQRLSPANASPVLPAVPHSNATLDLTDPDTVAAMTENLLTPEDQARLARLEEEQDAAYSTYVPFPPAATRSTT